MTKKLLFLTFFISFFSIGISQNNALNFDGTEDYVEVSYNAALNPSSFTIEAWVNVDAIKEEAIVSSRYEEPDPGSLNYGYSMYITSTNQIEFQTGGGNLDWDIFRPSYTVATGVWTHIAIVYVASSSTKKVYANGTLIGSSSPVDFSANTSSPLRIGAGAPEGSANYFTDGKIDEVRIWNDERTETEIRANMYGELSDPSSETNLVAYYKFNSTSGTTLTDSKGSHNGTLTSMAGSEWTPSAAFFGPKNCLDFDGTDDGVYCSNSVISGLTNLTIETWLYIDNTGSIQKITGQRDADAINGQFIFEINADGTLDYWDWDNSFGFNDNLTTAGTQISTGKWHHVAVVKNSSTASYYIDGLLKATEDISGSVVTYSATPNLAIGYDARDHGDHLDGKMDELRIWNSERTAEQIREFMCKSLIGNEANLVAYYPFDNTSGTNLQDMKGTIDGTLTGFSGSVWIASSAFNTWLNTSSTTYSTTSNWSSGAAPVSTDNVGIYNLTSEPDISGTPTFNSLYLGSGISTTLSSGMTVNASLILDKDLDLNGQTITLGSDATLIENTGILSGSSGSITTTRSLSNISAQDVAGLGATITTTENMGNTTITRGHTTSGINGLERYYQINPTTNSSLDATLVFSYDDSELNSQTEANLKLYKSSDGSTWTQQASSSVNTGNNTLSLSGIDSFSYWTGGDDRTPTVTTQAVSSITKYTATGNGNITELGITNPTEHGVCWSTSSGPTISDSKTTDGAVSATGAFTSSITGLVSNTTYYVKAYATNATGTAYGSEVNFTTPVSGADNYSVQSGNWNTASTWSTGVPTNNSTVDILSGHTVSLDVDMASSGVSLNVEEGGTLTSNGVEYGILIKTNGYFTVYGTIYVYSLDVKNNVDPKYIYSTGDVTVWQFFDHSGGQTVPITVDGKLTILNPGELRNDGSIIGSGTVTAANYVGTGSIFGLSPTSSISGSVAGYTWDGSSSTAWNTADNWVGGSVPSSSSNDVVIQNGLSNYPSISTTGNNCRNLLIESGAQMTIDASSDLTVSGTLTIKSDASGTGSLINNGTLSASVECERYIDDWNTGDGWHFLSSPVSSQAIRPEFVPTTPTSNEDFYAWDEVNDIWTNSESSSGIWNSSFDDNFIVGKGYLAAYSSDQTKTFSGTFNNSDISKTGLTYTGSSTHYGANFLGNPYPCALQWNQTTGSSGWNLNNVDGTAKIWNSTNASYSDINQGGIIPAMQGFMVLVSSTGTGSLKIYKGDRTHSPNSWYKSSEGKKIKLVVHDIEGGTAQESILLEREGATDGFDHEFDSPFFEGYAPKFYSKIGNIPASSNAIEEFSKETMINYSFCKNNSTEFYIELESEENLNNEFQVHLYDNVTGISHNLSKYPSYYFNSTDESVIDRFVVSFAEITSIDEFTKNDRIKIYGNRNSVHILNPYMYEGEVTVYNMYGKLIYSTKINKSSIEIDLSVPRGYYIVKFVNSELQKVEKVWLD